MNTKGELLLQADHMLLGPHTVHRTGLKGLWHGAQHLRVDVTHSAV